jgi:hypothetical protein
VPPDDPTARVDTLNEPDRLRCPFQRRASVRWIHADAEREKVDRERRQDET